MLKLPIQKHSCQTQDRNFVVDKMVAHAEDYGAWTGDEESTRFVFDASRTSHPHQTHDIEKPCNTETALKFSFRAVSETSLKEAP